MGLIYSRRLGLQEPVESLDQRNFLGLQEVAGSLLNQRPGFAKSLQDLGIKEASWGCGSYLEPVELSVAWLGWELVFVVAFWDLMVKETTRSCEECLRPLKPAVLKTARGLRFIVACQDPVGMKIY